VPVRVTADSSTYISGLLFGGKSLQLLDLARTGKIELALSDPIRDEVLSVLRDKFSWEDERLAILDGQLREFTRHIHRTPTFDVIKNRPLSNRAPECAVAAGSSFIVSDDDHLLRLRNLANIKIVTVANFLAREHGKKR
jgi:predicted nucleic acid-binding protein